MSEKFRSAKYSKLSHPSYGVILGLTEIDFLKLVGRLEVKMEKICKLNNGIKKEKRKYILG